MSNRIRWEATKYGGWTGHVGTLETWAFQIQRPVLAGERWLLTATFPGALNDIRPGIPDKLKAEAERWLKEFISSLGAIFEPEPDESAAFQVSEARDLLALWDGNRGLDGANYGTERVLAGMVRNLLAIVDPESAPRAAGTEE